MLADRPLSTTERELQSFLGFMNFYSDFIDEQTALTFSLYDLTAARKGTEPVHFTREDIQRFAELKRRLCAAPRLAHPNLEAPFTLDTDASKIAVGAVLLQRDIAGVERSISLFSKKLSPAQRNYSTFERECLAVVCELEHFRVYLLARPFRLRTDHRALQWLFSKEPMASARISGWLAMLMEYPMQIEYVRGCETRLRTRCLASTQYHSMLRSPESLQETSRPTHAPSQKLIFSTRAPTKSRSRALIQQSHE